MLEICLFSSYTTGKGIVNHYDKNKHFTRIYSILQDQKAFMGLFLVLTGIYAALTGYIVYFWQNKTTLSYQLTAERLILGCALIIPCMGNTTTFQQNSISFSMSTILLMTLWVMLLCYWIADLVYRLQGIQLFLFPTMLISLIFFYIFPGQSTGNTPLRI